MALFTGWAAKLIAFLSQNVGATAIVLSKDDLSPDLLLSDGRGGAKIARPTTHTIITPSDSNDVALVASQGVYVFGAGNLSYQTLGGAVIGPVAVVACTYIPGQFIKIMATGTAATNIIGLS